MYCENCYDCHCIDWFTVLYNTDSEGRYCSCLVPKGRMNFICKLALEKMKCLLFIVSKLQLCLGVEQLSLAVVVVVAVVLIVIVMVYDNSEF